MPAKKAKAPEDQLRVRIPKTLMDEITDQINGCKTTYGDLTDYVQSALRAEVARVNEQWERRSKEKTRQTR